MTGLEREMERLAKELNELLLKYVSEEIGGKPSSMDDVWITLRAPGGGNDTLMVLAIGRSADGVRVLQAAQKTTSIASRKKNVLFEG